jgi:hypothetical protein
MEARLVWFGLVDNGSPTRFGWYFDVVGMVNITIFCR